MQMTDLLDSVQYVTDHQGKKQGVLLDMDVWQALLQFIERKPASDPSASEDEQIKQAQVEDMKRERAMLREGTAFRKLHSFLYQHYAGQYVAIYNEQLLDSDANQIDLYRRVHEL